MTTTSIMMPSELRARLADYYIFRSEFECETEVEFVREARVVIRDHYLSSPEERTDDLLALEAECEKFLDRATCGRERITGREDRPRSMSSRC